MKKLGKFEILGKIGQGAMGVVYKARDPFIDRIVALKTVTTGLTEDPSLLKRFYSEARSAGNLRHPNIVTIYELGHEGEMPFIAMQFLEGESLDKLIERLPNLTLSQKIGFIVYVCRALDYAHKQNPPVIHRDIKPGNVMVAPDGSVAVVDFGIARLGESTVSQSAGLLVGTLGYMSPQMFRGGTADARSDIWSAGVMFYEVLAYRRPFNGDSAAALMSSIVLEEHSPILQVAPGTPEEIQKILDRMLAKDVEARYQSMEDVLLDLEPVWRRLLHADIEVVLEKSERLVQEGDLQAAKSEVAQILNWDPQNTRAKGLNEKICAELRRQQVFPQVKARVEIAQKLLADGRNEEAKFEAEAALKLDSSFQPAREMVRQAQAAIERSREIARAVNTYKQRMAEGALTEAEVQLDKVLSLDPGNDTAREQLKQLHEERSRRERRKQRDTLLQRARTFWTKLEYDECISLLQAAEKDFPGDPEVQEFLDSARHDQAEQRRQILLAEIRTQLSTQQFESALKSVDTLFEQFPGDATAANLKIRAQQGWDQQLREQRLSEGKSELRAFIKKGKYEETISRGEELQREFTSDFELSELLLLARAEQTQIEQKRRLEQVTREIREAIEKGRLAEGIQAAEKALTEFPKNAQIVTLLHDAKREVAEKEKQALLKQRIREVERMLERQQLTEAIDLARQTITTIGPDPRLADTLRKAEMEREFREQKKRRQDETLHIARTMLAENKTGDAASLVGAALETKLFPGEDPRITELLNEIATKEIRAAGGTAAANESDPGSGGTRRDPPPVSQAGDVGKDYVYMRTIPKPEAPQPGEQNVQASAAAASLGGGFPAQPSSVSPGTLSGAPVEPRSPGPPTLAPTGSEAPGHAKEKEQHTFAAMEKYLAKFLGPMAGIIVQKVAAKARDREELFALLAQRLPSEKDRQAFLARKDELLGGSAVMHAASASSESTGHTASRTAELTPAAIRHASELLARYLGPVSQVLTERAAQRADSLRSLYLSLGEHLKDARERAKFLSDGGFPQT